MKVLDVDLENLHVLQDELEYVYERSLTQIWYYFVVVFAWHSKSWNIFDIRNNISSCWSGIFKNAKLIWILPLSSFNSKIILYNKIIDQDVSSGCVWKILLCNDLNISHSQYWCVFSISFIFASMPSRDSFETSSFALKIETVQLLLVHEWASSFKLTCSFSFNNTV